MLTLGLALLLGGTAAQPAPNADLTFVGPDSLTVQCVDGCPDDKVYLPERFPSLHVSERGTPIRLRFRAAGFRSTIDDVTLRPGKNRIVVELNPAENAALTFVGPETLTVQCLTGCGDDGVYVSDQFPSQVLSRDAGPIRLRFRAEGFRTRTNDFRLRPGQNQIVVDMNKA